jgi:cell fate regulator YaaT (PSP1 superfamily)
LVFIKKLGPIFSHPTNNEKPQKSKAIEALQFGQMTSNTKNSGASQISRNTQTVVRLPGKLLSHIVVNQNLQTFFPVSGIEFCEKRIVTRAFFGL